MDLILDTHVILWMLLNDLRLKPKQIELLEDPANRFYVSAVSAFEMATKVRIGKLPEAMEISRDFRRICTDFDYRELEITQDRIRQFERQVAQIRKTETNGENYRMSAAGFLADIDRMNLEIRDYLWSLPTEQPTSAA